MNAIATSEGSERMDQLPIDKFPEGSQECLKELPTIQSIHFINPISGAGSGALLWQVQFRKEGENNDRSGILKLGSQKNIAQELNNHRDAENTVRQRWHEQHHTGDRQAFDQMTQMQKPEFARREAEKASGLLL